MPTTQISAHIPEALKERMERYVRLHGTTRAHLVEQALLHHLQALDELPPDVIVPARIVLTPESAALVRDRLERPRAPTRKMRKLFDDR